MEFKVCTSVFVGPNEVLEEAPPHSLCFGLQDMEEPTGDREERELVRMVEVLYSCPWSCTTCC